MERANRRCEYCLIHEDDTLYGCEVDHIVSEKHGGTTTADNLACACTDCNRNKGSDVGSFVPTPHAGIFCRFFNPRTDKWEDHFALSPFDGAAIVPKTDIGVVTERMFNFNETMRLNERIALALIGRYPTSEARRQL